MASLDPEFHVLVWPPHGSRSSWTYATCGMRVGPARPHLEVSAKGRSEPLRPERRRGELPFSGHGDGYQTRDRPALQADSRGDDRSVT